MMIRNCYVAIFVVFAVSNAHSQVVVDSASTAAEGYQRGMASVIDAQGQRNLANSQAAINLTSARSSQINNQISSVNAYWEKKGIYNAHEQQKMEAIDYQRAQYLAKNGLQPLSPTVFNRTTGAITWPGQLKVAEFDKYRTVIDGIFAKRAKSGMLDGEDYLQATNTFKAWRAELTSKQADYPRPIISDLLKFLLELNHDLNYSTT